MPQNINLEGSDWDDTALVKAYDKGMSLKVSDLEALVANEKLSILRPKWKVGDHCRAIYSGDNSWYEAKILSIDGDIALIEYLGYHEEAEVALNCLDQSMGKKERKKQIKNAKNSYAGDDVNEALSDGAMCNVDRLPSDDYKNEQDNKPEQSEIASPRHSHRRRGHLRQNESQMFDQSVNFGVAENSYHTPCHVARYPDVPPVMIPAPPNADLQNSSLYAMLTSWYMAGYYTGLNQAQRGSSQQHCHCRHSHY